MKVFLMLGGNIGNSAEIFQQACQRLTKGGLRDIRMSGIFRSTAVDCVPDTPDFSDAALSGEWDDSPEKLLALCQQTEREAGRPAEHSSRESRTLDVDIILFGDRVLRSPELTIPHPRAAVREFVLEPLCQLAPEVIFPDSGLSAEETLKIFRFKD